MQGSSPDAQGMAADMCRQERFLFLIGLDDRETGELISSSFRFSQQRKTGRMCIIKLCLRSKMF